MLIQINLWIIKEENLCRLTPYWCYLLLTFSYPFFTHPYIWPIYLIHLLCILVRVYSTRSIMEGGGVVLVWPGQQPMIPISDPCTDMILYISINIYNTRAPDPGCQLWRRQKKMLYNENIESHFTILCTVWYSILYCFER